MFTTPMLRLIDRMLYTYSYELDVVRDRFTGLRRELEESWKDFSGDREGMAQLTSLPYFDPAELQEHYAMMNDTGNWAVSAAVESRIPRLKDFVELSLDDMLSTPDATLHYFDHIRPGLEKFEEVVDGS